MTGYKTHRKYPQSALIKRVTVVCGLCPAQDGDVCYGNRKRGVCPVDEALDALEDGLERERTPPTQTRLDGIVSQSKEGHE